MKLRKAFTLMEVNLAMMVMAVGTLGLVSLYTFGYRENRQSMEDVKATGVAEKIFGSLELALSSTEIKWSEWKALPVLLPDGNELTGGWGSYYDFQNSCMRSSNTSGSSVYQKLIGISNVSVPGYDDQNMYTALVVSKGGDQNSRRLTIGLRASNRNGDLMGQPIYYTEIVFQGDPDK